MLLYGVELTGAVPMRSDITMFSPAETDMSRLSSGGGDDIVADGAYADCEEMVLLV